MMLQAKYVSFYLDCDTNPRSKHLGNDLGAREPFTMATTFDPAGKVVLGATTGGNGLEAAVQQVAIASSPDAAFDYCYDLLPDCNSPLPVTVSQQTVVEEKKLAAERPASVAEARVDSESAEQQQSEQEGGNAEENMSSHPRNIYRTSTVAKRVAAAAAPDEEEEPPEEFKEEDEDEIEDPPEEDGENINLEETENDIGSSVSETAKTTTTSTTTTTTTTSRPTTAPIVFTSTVHPSTESDKDEDSYDEESEGKSSTEAPVINAGSDDVALPDLSEDDFSDEDERNVTPILSAESTPSVVVTSHQQLPSSPLPPAIEEKVQFITNDISSPPVSVVAPAVVEQPLPPSTSLDSNTNGFQTEEKPIENSDDSNGSALVNLRTNRKSVVVDPATEVLRPVAVIANFHPPSVVNVTTTSSNTKSDISIAAIADHCLPGLVGSKGAKGEKGARGLDGIGGVVGPPGHVFLVPLPVSTDTKGPDQTDSLRAILEHHADLEVLLVKVAQVFLEPHLNLLKMEKKEIKVIKESKAFLGRLAILGLEAFPEDVAQTEKLDLEGPKVAMDLKGQLELMEFRAEMEKLGHKAQKEILENVGQLEKLVILVYLELKVIVDLEDQLEKKEIKGRVGPVEIKEM
ncbi:hypothetical protein TYRP_014425 [Tyrophagus putrescentiae]|nr:hypothetical protein TYRP_014425 [Tyrophagus putrescentiae]